MNTQTFAARLSTLPPSRRDVLTAVFRKAQDIVLPTGSRWPDPENSIGRYIGKTKWYHIWEATGPARDVFNKIAPSIKAYLEDAVEPISSRVTWSMYMIGRVPSLTSPSIIFCCGVLEHRRHVRNTIKYSGILSGYSGIKTGHLPRPPDFNQLVPLADEEASQYWDGNIILLTSRFKSPCGSQLFVNAHGPDSEGLSAKATIGGVIQLGDHCYYTTAAHALLPTPYSASGHEALLPNQDYKEGDDALSLDSSVGVDSATTHPLKEKSTAAFSPEHSQISEKVLGKSKDTQIGKGDIPSPGDSKSHHLTDNSPSFIANPEEMLLKPTGRPFITSMGPQGQSTGLDYVLINMSSRERIVENMISLGHYDPSILKVQSVSRSNPRDMEVFAVTRRGAIKGYVSGTPTYSSAPGKRTFSKMFKVNLDGPLYRGDCGTWVIDATDGDLFGHIVIGSPGDRTALLTPFADIFDDIFLRLGETPTFPTATNDIVDKRAILALAGGGIQVEGSTDFPYIKSLSEVSTATKHSSMPSELVVGMKVPNISRKRSQPNISRKRSQPNISRKRSQPPWLQSEITETPELVLRKAPSLPKDPGGNELRKPRSWISSPRQLRSQETLLPST